MPNNTDVADYTGVFRLTSTSEPHRKVIRRNRQVVSCLPCRSRKLRCDRQQPCASCVKRHDEASCKFFLWSPAAAVQKSEVQARLQVLESLVSGLMHQDGASPGGDPVVGSGHLSKEGNEVRFVGATSYEAVLDCIRDLQGFVDASTAATTSYLLLGPADQRPLTINEVMRRLPLRVECDDLLTSYFQQVYMIPATLHTGQFQRTYEKFWQDPEKTSLLWISILFTLLSTSIFQQASRGAGTNRPAASVVTKAEDKIADLSSMAYRCLVAGNYLCGKPYCVEATLLFGMHLVLQKRDADPLCWHSISTAVRLAQRMGYHRDASNMSPSDGALRISPFEAEMRRRTWFTLEWFDVVHSFQLGIPPIIQDTDVDTQLPANLHDDEFNEDSKVLPRARPTGDFTPILGFIYYSKQTKLLRRVVQQALGAIPPSYGDVRRLDADLRALHDDVPPSLRYRPIRESGFADVPDVIMRRLLCEMIYLKSMCVLHRRYLTLEKKNGVYDGSREACRDASLRLLDLQAEFEEHSRRGARLFEKRYMLTNTGYHDFLLAAMCICLDLLQDTDRKVNALKRAHTLWSMMSGMCKEAAHATEVLKHILSTIPQQQDQGRLSSLDDGGGGGVDKAVSSSSAVPNTEPSNANGLRNCGKPALIPGWSSTATNNQEEPTALTERVAAANKGHSVLWNYAWLDNLGTRKDRASSSSNYYPLDDVLAGRVDWVSALPL
ncbi:hypothetical protein M406DRAFT_264595 [Cryphonectria parasitica EP155]|uniref:Zn(2)-C6 fungal-type domain-containing protein n=1 Tax=Cryphonectria parasitica (strain ATCC 38755 / EP155) TaxID=660469 RepID=A0A9P4XX12_CRYP1|nr:uncharacterized protein M406DRAFT_264595 [Cryphonectria parasitica EP155]KAF3762907.1 hypothetical protein M406DRAFT_264595 [Cryphonectria parasitica EP155]